MAMTTSDLVLRKLYRSRRDAFGSPCVAVTADSHSLPGLTKNILCLGVRGMSRPQKAEDLGEGTEVPVRIG